MNPGTTALVLIGYQNDYFAKDGVVRGVVEVEGRIDEVKYNTIAAVEALASTPLTIISTPIQFTAEYAELIDPVGILKTIKEVGAFNESSTGSETINELRVFGDRVIEIPGKRGLNAFSNTDLATTLESRGIDHICIAGVVTSICVDSTGRAAADLGYGVSVLSDCTAGRSEYEQDFFLKEIFPLYAGVLTSSDLVRAVSERMAVAV